MQSLLEQEGLASAIFNKAEINVQQVRDRTTEFIDSQPKVNNASSVYLGRSLDSLLDRAEKYRKEFGDEYISVEHLILGFIKDDRVLNGAHAPKSLRDVEPIGSVSLQRGQPPQHAASLR